MAQQGRPEEDAGHHFAYDSRLTKPAKQRTHCSTNAENDDNLQDESEQVKHQFALLGSGAGLRSARNSTGLQEEQSSTDSAPVMLPSFAEIAAVSVSRRSGAQPL